MGEAEFRGWKLRSSPKPYPREAGDMADTNKEIADLNDMKTTRIEGEVAAHLPG